MRRFLFVWAGLLCITLWGCSWGSAHQHTFGNWTVKESPTCAKAGTEERICTECQTAETRPVAKLPHDLGAYNICKVCKFVETDPNAKVVELGIFSSSYYTGNPTANSVWDVKIWGDMVYRGAGDYDKNSGATPILAFNKATQTWVQTGITADEAVHRFIEIDGTLYTPGVDPTESWELGNFYVLDGEKWQKVRTLPNGLHCFDMIGFEGKIFAGLGTETVGNTVAVSQDKGESFSFVPLCRDGALLDTSGYEYSRTYAFVEYDSNLYAMIRFKKVGVTSYDTFIFRYVDGNMVYQSTTDGRLQGSSGRNLWQGKLEWKGVCYLTSTALNAITDFSKPETHKQIPMPNGGVVTDILLYNDELYVLSYVFKEDMTYGVAIYRSATGAEGSFTEVTAFDYAGIPLSFDFDGSHFYVGIGSSFSDASKTGMLLRVKA